MIKAQQQKARINNEIRCREVRLIDAKGEQAGIQSISAALNMAEDANLDLVEVAPNSHPPVCRIMDYGKYLFEQKKSKKANKAKPMKEVKFRPVTEMGDYQVKLKNVVRFLEAGHKVKLTVRFRGREAAFAEQGLAILNRVQVDAKAAFSRVDQTPKKEGRQMVMVLAP